MIHRKCSACHSAYDGSSKKQALFHQDGECIRPQANCFCGELAVIDRPCRLCELAAKTSRIEARTAADILQQMADTFRERNAIYGDNYKRVGEVMVAMFPNGVVLRTAEDFNRWHLFELLVVKLTRFANSGLLHSDSVHDASVYGAMVESLLSEGTTPIKGVNE